MEKIKCCFCGKELNSIHSSNDIRPIVSNNGDRCCNCCNEDIVIPNRIKFWFQASPVFTVKNKKTGEFVEDVKNAKFNLFSSELDVEKYLKENNLKKENYEIQKIFGFFE